MTQSSKKFFMRGSFVAATATSSRMIEWFGGGEFSHVDIMLDDGTLLGARSDVITPPGLNARPIPAGVQIRPNNYEHWPRRMIVRREVTERQHNLGLLFLMGRDGKSGQLRKPYDKIGILDFALGRIRNRDWRDPSSWWCSELWTRYLEAAEVIRPLPPILHQVTPGTAAALSIAAGFEEVTS